MKGLTPSCTAAWRIAAQLASSVMKTVLKVALGIILAAAVLIGGCVALLGGAANEVADEIDKQQKANSITMQQFRETKTGTSRSQIEDRFGEPSDAQEFETEIPELDAKSKGSCVYYNRRGGELGDIFQFCFENGKLQTKNSF